MSAKKIWIDCDPGFDDVLAILAACAFPEKLEFLGISTVGGNQDIKKVTRHAQLILQLLKKEIPLHEGSSEPLIGPLVVPGNATNQDYLEDYTSAFPLPPLYSMPALLGMYEGLMDSDEKVTIVAIGPLTNLALLVKAFPQVKEKISEIVLMGGGFSHGNITPLSEFNIYADPEAAKIIFHAGIPITMASLDVTEKAFITKEEIAVLPEGTTLADFLKNAFRFYQEKSLQFGFSALPLHDLCTVAYLLEPTLFSGEEKFVDVVTSIGEARGLTYMNPRLKKVNHAPTFILKEVNRQEFLQLLIQSIKKFR